MGRILNRFYLSLEINTWTLLLLKVSTKSYKSNYHLYKSNYHHISYFSILDFGCSQTVHKFECCDRRGKARDAILLNPHKKPLLCVVNNEAEIFIWRSFEDPQTFSLASAFKAFGEGVVKSKFFFLKFRLLLLYMRIKCYIPSVLIQECSPTLSEFRNED